jgi:methyl-accepting chemotaxis protein
VVANQVKELAKQTAAATEDISRKIEAMQSDAKGAVTATASISGVVGQVNDISGPIATALEEQSATNEMSGNVAEAARGAGKLAPNILGVAQAAQGTLHGATDSPKEVRSLAEMSTHLWELVGRFKLERGRRATTNGHGNKSSWSAKQSERTEELEEKLAAR